MSGGTASQAEVLKFFTLTRPETILLMHCFMPLRAYGSSIPIQPWAENLERHYTAKAMLMPQADRKKIYEHLFEDGVCIAKKDYNLKSHPEIKGVRNLFVIKALKSLASRGYVKEQFAWRHYYFYLSAEGIAYLREYLGLPEDVFPATHRHPPRAELPRPPFAAEKGTRGFGKPELDRTGYRGGYQRAADGEEKPAVGAVAAAE